MSYKNDDKAVSRSCAMPTPPTLKVLICNWKLLQQIYNNVFLKSNDLLDMVQIIVMS